MQGRTRLASMLAAATALSLGGCRIDAAGGDPSWLVPSLIVSAVAILAAALGVLFTYLVVQEHFEDRKRARTLIFAGVNARLEVALRATGPSSITAARALLDTVQLYLGPVLELNSGAGKAIDQLKKALDGKIKDTHTPTVIVCPTSIVAPATAAASAAAAGGAASASAAAGGTQVVIQAPPPPPPKGTERDATTREQMIEVRLALEAFAEFWTPAAIDERLRRAQAALLISKPYCDTKPDDPCAEKTGA